MTKQVTIYTVGHSTHTSDYFIELLKRNGVTAIADVRSSPFSRINPQFNQRTLSTMLKSHGIAYVFVGAELGARTDDPTCYENGRVRYDRLAQTTAFKSGIRRLLAGALDYRIALMCAEKEPLDCHRTLLVGRALASAGVSVVHILADGSTELHSQTMARLLEMVGLPQADLFRTHEELVEAACLIRERKIAYVDTGSTIQE